MGPWLVAAVSAATSAIIALLLGWGVVGWAIVSRPVVRRGAAVWSRVVENGRAAKDRLVTTLVWSAFAVALVPLVALIWKVLKEGAPVISTEFLTFSMRNVIGHGGGIYHAILGTLLITRPRP